MPGFAVNGCSECNDLIQSADGERGPHPRNTSEGPVRYADGVIDFVAVDLWSDGFGTGWGQTRGWSNNPQYSAGGVNGNGTTVSQLPTLQQVSGVTTLAVVSNGTTARFFDLVGGVYVPRYDSQVRLSYDATYEQYLVIDGIGNQIRFDGFGTGLPAGQRGQLVSFTDPAGNVTAVTSRTADGRAAEVQRGPGGASVTESFLYTYLPTGNPNAGLLDSVILRRRVNGGAWSVVRQVQYTYYYGSNDFGNLGDLKTAVVRDGSGATIDTQYYRYYRPYEPDGYAGGLRYIFNPASFDRLQAAVAAAVVAGTLPSGTTAFTAPDRFVGDYADNYFEYDAQNRVSREMVQGAGCSTCSSGLGQYTFQYTPSGFADGFNAWKTKTVETLPDLNQDIVYTNAYGEMLLKVFHETATGREWAWYYRYDAAGRLVLSANPSAVSGYSEASADLLVDQGGNLLYLRDGSGLLAQYTYYQFTSADDFTPGGVAGYLESTSLRRGEFGLPVPQDHTNYIVRTGSTTTVYATATETVYRYESGLGAQTTTYGYTWFGSTVRPESVTVTLPPVGTDQNGPGTSDVTTTFFDTYGQPIWAKDGDGFIHYAAYDPATGAVVTSITDVGTIETGMPALPPGFTILSGVTHAHLKTTAVVDALGRPTLATEPNGRQTTSTYYDVAHAATAAVLGAAAPIVVTRDDRGRRYSEVYTVSAGTTFTLSGTDLLPSAQPLTLSRTQVNNAGQLVAVDDYYDLTGATYSVTAPTLGTAWSFTSPDAAANYYRTEYAYDDRGRLKRVLRPTGTITRLLYDAPGRLTQTWVGTDDVPTSGYWSPTNTAGNNLVTVSENVYDGGGIGDGNLTQTTLFPYGNDPASMRVTQFFYDWRNRLVAAKSGVQASESADTQRPIIYYEYDNLGEVVAREQYDGDGVTVVDSNGDGVPDRPAAGLLRARATAEYDDRGRVFRTHVWSVDPNNGSVSFSSLHTDTWYYRRGEVVKTAAPGGLVTKMKYDGAGRPVATYTTDGGDDTTWADALTVTGDAVLEQTEADYDGIGNVLATRTRQRFHDATGAGALGTPTSTTQPKARVYYAGFYYDAAGRLTDAVNVGTNAGTAWTRPPTVPARSDTVLVTSTAYDNAGRVFSVTDPRSIESRTTYDLFGRPTRTVEAYTDGVISDTDDRTTEFTYFGPDLTRTVTLRLTGGGQQTTRYVYGVTTGPLYSSFINSNDLLREVDFPDKATGLPSSAAGDMELYVYNALGQTYYFVARNSTSHHYTFDVLGRQTSDSGVGMGVDGTVRGIDTAYDSAGRAYLFTSYDTPFFGGTIINQVRRDYNGRGQVLAEYQAHGGAVDTATTPVVRYSYSEMAGGANHSRPTSLTYPDGRMVSYNYGTAGGLDDGISRLTSLSDISATLEAYTYLGIGTAVKRAHPQPGVDLTYVKLAGEADSTDSGDQYTGLDRFGRVRDQRWVDISGTALDRARYGYDRDSNRLYRENLVSGGYSELYHVNGAANGYDALNQLTDFRRGVLSDTNGDGIPDTVATATRSQSWDADAAGNFESVTSDGTAQTRTHNKQNRRPASAVARSPTTTPAT